MLGELNPRSGFRSIWLIPLATGLLLRLGMLATSIGIPVIEDEVHYVRLGAEWYLADTYTAVRPPGYPWLMSSAIAAFGAAGPTVLKFLQVLLSPLIGLATMLLADRSFGGRAAMISGAVWAGYLPLIGMTHLFWPETVFLVLLIPILLLLLAHLEEPDAPAAPLRILGCGLLVGLALLLKDSAVVLTVLAAGAICIESLARRRNPLGRLALFTLAVLVMIVPWMLRTWDVYERIGPPGSTVGMNFTVGMNGKYRNFDHPRWEAERAYPPESRVRRWLLEPQNESWEESSNPNLIDRGRENVRRGLAFMAERPGFFLRTRLKKLADLLSPTSFVARHASRGLYHAPLDGKATRIVLMLLAYASTAALLLTAWAGIVFTARRSKAWWLLVASCAIFVMPSLLNAMSRGRVPLLPALIVFAGSMLAGPGEAMRSSTKQRVVFVAGVLALLLFWSLNASALAVMLERVGERG
jgi:hypothetical protein